MFTRAQMVGGVLALLSLATPSTKAQSDAPLEKSARDLRALESARQQTATSAERTGEGAKGFTLAIPDAAPAQPPRPPRNQNEIQPRANRANNWLLNGVRQLETLSKDPTLVNRSTENDLGARDTPSAGKPDLDEKTQPQSLLDIYTQQREQELASKRQLPPDEENSRPDAFAPFLQNWLAQSSPGHLGFDESARGRSDSTKALVQGSRESNGASSNGPTNPGNISGDLNRALTTTQVMTNPYLQPEQVLVRQHAGPVARDGSTEVSLEPMQTAQEITPLSGRGTVPPEAQNNQKMPPVVPSTEAKKYFPQLKKF